MAGLTGLVGRTQAVSAHQTAALPPSVLLRARTPLFGSAQGQCYYRNLYTLFSGVASVLIRTDLYVVFNTTLTRGCVKAWERYSSYDFYTNCGRAVSYSLKVPVVTPEEQNGWCEALYESQAAKLVLYGRALGLSHAEAEDVLQETFIALLHVKGQLQKPAWYALRSYRNRALNYRRSLWRRLTRELESRRWFEHSPQESADETRAMRALAELPPEQREVIVLRIWHGRTYEEISSLLEISPNTAAGRYRYGMQKLRESLRGAGYERNERIGETIAILDAAPPLAGS